MNPYQFNLKEVEKKVILEAIIYSEGNLSLTRDLLGVSKASLYRRLKTHKIKLSEINEIRDYNAFNYKGFKKSNV